MPDYRDMIDFAHDTSCELRDRAHGLSSAALGLKRVGLTDLSNELFESAMALRRIAEELPQRVSSLVSASATESFESTSRVFGALVIGMIRGAGRDPSPTEKSLVTSLVGLPDENTGST